MRQIKQLKINDKAFRLQFWTNLIYYLFLVNFVCWLSSIICFNFKYNLIVMVNNVHLITRLCLAPIDQLL